MKPLLSINNLTHLYAPGKGFSDVSFELWPGEVLGIVGESGSGKTTLLKSISARLTPQNGDILYEGASLYGMREAERRLESAQTQSNAIVASAQSRAANMIRDANEQAQFLAGQENVTELARQKARAILDQAQTKADHLTQGADQYCTTVMEGLSQQLGKLSQDVQAGLNVLEERQRAAREQMPHLTLNDYPEAQ